MLLPSLIRLAPARRFSGLSFPMKVRPQIGGLRAATLAHEQRLKIGQSDIIWPSITADPSPMAAMVVTAIDKQAADAHLAHFTEVIFCCLCTNRFPSRVF